MNVMQNILMDEIASLEDIPKATQHRDYGERGEEEEENVAIKPGQTLGFDVSKMQDASWDESNPETYSMEPEEILRRAGVDPSEGYMPQLSLRESRENERQGITVDKKMAVLPSLEEIQSMYGSEVHILGLERCEEFREAVPEADRLMGPAGLFNSVSYLLSGAKVNTKRFTSNRYTTFQTGILPQAPWGKHNPG